MLGWFSSARSNRDRTQKRFAKGRGAERDALRELGRLGFDVLATQQQGTAHIVVDGNRIEVPVRADYLVKRWGRKALVEVKSGEAEREPTDVSTRRQLLEYWAAFPGMSLYHLDTVSGTVQRIAFEYHLRPPRSWRFRITAMALVAFLLAVAALWFTRR